MALPIVMLQQMFLRTSQKIQLGVLFGLVGVNIVCNILRTVYTIVRDLVVFPDQNAMWPILQITTAVILCSLPCYGSLLSRKKKQTIPSYTIESGSFAQTKLSGKSESFKPSDSFGSLDRPPMPIYKSSSTKVEVTTVY